MAFPSPAASPAHPFLDKGRPIRWSRLTPDKLEPDIQEAMRRTRASVEEISRLRPEEMTYENTFGALEKSNGLLTEGMCKAYVLKSLCDSGKLRKAMDSVGSPRVRLPFFRHERPGPVESPENRGGTPAANPSDSRTETVHGTKHAELPGQRR